MLIVNRIQGHALNGTQVACKLPDKLGVKNEPIAGSFISARVRHFCPASVLSFVCPKESTKEKGSLSGGANDLRGLRCF
jgi:hypothetical protein